MRKTLWKDKLWMSAAIILQMHDVLPTKRTAESLQLAVVWQTKHNQRYQLMKSIRSQVPVISPSFKNLDSG